MPEVQVGAFTFIDDTVDRRIEFPYDWYTVDVQISDTLIVHSETQEMVYVSIANCTGCKQTDGRLLISACVLITSLDEPADLETIKLRILQCLNKED